MKQILSNLKKNNRGSGIVTVLIAFLFLTAFGTLALYLTYTSAEMVSTERKGIEADYNATSCMEQIKAGLQISVSNAIVKSYNEVMPDYVKYNQDISELFKERFKSNLLDSKVINYETNEPSGIDLFLAGSKYSCAALSSIPSVQDGEIVKNPSFVMEDRGGVCTVRSGANKNTGSLVITDKAVTLKDITVSYKDRSGIKSEITSDIVVKIPDIGYLLTQYSISGIPDFTLISAENIVHKQASTVHVTGSAYANNLNLTNAGQFNVESGGVFVIKDEISSSGGMQSGGSRLPRFMSAPGTTVWAKDIVVNDKSDITLNGATYVNNDLTFTGTDSTVNLGGTYYGFGCDENTPNESSSIIFNKPTTSTTKNKLNFSNLNSLTLAGVCFVSDRTDDYIEEINDEGETIRVPIPENDRHIFNSTSSANARTGMSIGTKYNQIIYFAPKGSVTPYEYNINTYNNETYYQMTEETFYAKEDKGTNTQFYVKGAELSDGNFVMNATSEKPASGFVPAVHAAELTTDTDGITFYRENDLKKVAYFALDGESYEYKPDKGYYELAANGKSDAYFPSDSGMTEKKYSDYDISLLPIYEKIGVDTEVTFFFKFGSQADANNYFYDYYNMNQQNAFKITSNLESYVEFISPDRPTKRTSGNTFSSTGGIVEALAENFNALTTEAKFIKEIFINYYKTLSNKPIDVSAISDPNPYKTYIDIGKITTDITKGNRLYFYNYDNASNEYKTTAVVVYGDYTYDNAESDNMHIIIATGQVTVKRNYAGVIIAGGNIEIDVATGDVTLSRYSQGVADAYGADTIKHESQTDEIDKIHGNKDEIGGTKDRVLKDYFRIDILKEFQSSNSGAGDAWNVEDLVQYDNWRI